MNKEEINKLTQKIESCWDENNPGDVRSFDERLKQKLTPEEYELITKIGYIVIRSFYCLLYTSPSPRDA